MSRVPGGGEAESPVVSRGSAGAEHGGGAVLNQPGRLNARMKATVTGYERAE